LIRRKCFFKQHGRCHSLSLGDFSAGAMLFIYKEWILESHGDRKERTSTYSFIIGIY
jgi:hypothetical protein